MTASNFGNYPNHANKAVNAAANGNMRAANFHANNAINAVANGAGNVSNNKMNEAINYLKTMKTTINNINKVVRSPIKKNMRFNVN